MIKETGDDHGTLSHPSISRRKSHPKMAELKRFSGLSKEEDDDLLRREIHRHLVLDDFSSFVDFAAGGVRVDRVEPGLVVWTFRVLPRLTDREGNMATGAIATLIDTSSFSLLEDKGRSHMSSTVTLSISYLSTPKLDDVLELRGRLSGRKGIIVGCSIEVRNKTSGLLVAEGKLILFEKLGSKL